MNEIKHKSLRKTAKPRTGRTLDAVLTVGSSGGQGGGGIPTSNFVKKKGENSQEIEGNIRVKGEVTAYSTGEGDLELPIAGTDALGCVKAGTNVNISPDGTISVAGGGGSINGISVSGTGNAVTGMSLSEDGKLIYVVKATVFATSAELTTHAGNTTLHLTAAERVKWNTAYDLSHTHNNKAYLDVINQALNTTANVNFRSVKATGEIIAYSTGGGDIDLPHASGSIYGAVKVGADLSVSDGVVSWAMPDTVRKAAGFKVGGSGNLYVAFSGGNGIYGVGNTGVISNLYLNYVSASVNVRIDPSGLIYSNGTQVTSDERLKNRGESITVLDKIAGLNTFYYTRKDIENAKTEIGVSAQEVEQVFPEIVMTQTTDDLEKYKSVDYSRLAAICMQGVKELMKEVDDLKAEIKLLKDGNTEQ